MGHFRSSVWDPILIISQIVTMQCIFYIGIGFWIVVVNYIGGQHQAVDQIFNYQYLQAKGIPSRLLMIAFVINTATSAVGLWYVTKRTKLCWDFVVTSFVIHLVCCCVYNGAFPRSLSWWLIHIIGVIISTVLGEFLCLHTELKAIPLAGGSAPKTDL